MNLRSFDDRLGIVARRSLGGTSGHQRNAMRVTPVASSIIHKDVVGPVPQRRVPLLGSETPRSTEDSFGIGKLMVVQGGFG